MERQMHHHQQSRKTKKRIVRLESKKAMITT